MWLLGVILRLIFPVIVIYFGVRYVSGLLGNKSKIDGMNSEDDSRSKDDDNVIEICTKCGKVNKPFHRCKPLE